MDDVNNATLLTDAILGAGFGGDPLFATEMEKIGLARFSGNQYNMKWEYDKDALSNLPKEKLAELYNLICKIRNCRG